MSLDFTTATVAAAARAEVIHRHLLNQRTIHQLRRNRLTSKACYQAFIDQITSLICPQWRLGQEIDEHLLLSWPKWAAERQHHFGDSIDIKDAFWDNKSLVEFLISLGHLTSMQALPDGLVTTTTTTTATTATTITTTT